MDTPELSPWGLGYVTTIHEAIHDGDEAMVFALIDELAEDESISSRDLTLLALLRLTSLRVGVARNLRTPAPVLRWLYENSPQTVKAAAVMNPRCPSFVTNRVWAQELAWAKENPTLLNTFPEVVTRPEEVSQEKWDEAEAHTMMRFALGDNSNSSVPDLNRLARVEEDARVLAALGSNVSAPPIALRHIVRKARVLGFPELRVGVAQNPSTPARILEFLAKDRDEAVRAAVTHHPNCPPELREHLTS